MAHHGLMNIRANAGLILGVLLAGSAWADAQLAFDKGCYNCHGDAPRRNGPAFAELAPRYAALRADAAKLNERADQLRQPSFLGRVGAHERLDHRTAVRLVTWIAHGAAEQR